MKTTWILLIAVLALSQKVLADAPKKLAKKAPVNAAQQKQKQKSDQQKKKKMPVQRRAKKKRKAECLPLAFGDNKVKLDCSSPEAQEIHRYFQLGDENVSGGENMKNTYSMVYLIDKEAFMNVYSKVDDFDAKNGNLVQKSLMVQKGEIITAAGIGYFGFIPVSKLDNMISKNDEAVKICEQEIAEFEELQKKLKEANTVTEGHQKDLNDLKQQEKDCFKKEGGFSIFGGKMVSTSSQNPDKCQGVSNDYAELEKLIKEANSKVKSASSSQSQIQKEAKAKQSRNNENEVKIQKYGGLRVKLEKLKQDLGENKLLMVLKVLIDQLLLKGDDVVLVDKYDFLLDLVVPSKQQKSDDGIKNIGSKFNSMFNSGVKLTGKTQFMRDIDIFHRYFPCNSNQFHKRDSDQIIKESENVLNLYIAECSNVVVGAQNKALSSAKELESLLRKGQMSTSFRFQGMNEDGSAFKLEYMDESLSPRVSTQYDFKEPITFVDNGIQKDIEKDAKAIAIQKEEAGLDQLIKMEIPSSQMEDSKPKKDLTLEGLQDMLKNKAQQKLQEEIKNKIQQSIRKKIQESIQKKIGEMMSQKILSMIRNAKKLIQYTKDIEISNDSKVGNVAYVMKFEFNRKQFDLLMEGGSPDAGAELQPAGDQEPKDELDGLEEDMKKKKRFRRKRVTMRKAKKNVVKKNMQNGHSKRLRRRRNRRRQRKITYYEQ